MTSRRNWLKNAIALTTAIPVVTGLSEQLMAAPMSEAEKILFASKKLPPVKVRLGSNENPYGPSERAKQAMIQSLSECNRYPFDVVRELKEILAKKEGVTPEHISVGSGSGDLLCATGITFAMEKGTILSPYPTFTLLMACAEIYGAKWDKVDLNEKLEIDYKALAAKVTADTKLVFICNPNNPTGTLVDPKVVRNFCEEVSLKATVFSDEAYLEFLPPNQQVSMIDMVKEGKNVIVSRTFSKIYGLAGCRVGYIVAQPEMIRKIAKYQTGIPANISGVAAAKASLGDEAFMELSRKKNAEARQHLTSYLKQKGLFHGESLTNFVFFDPKSDAKQILDKMLERNIVIRVWDYQGKQWLRVSIGTLDEMKIFTKAYDEIAI
jgi:histidinol-phosphate aminotransferase